MDKSQPQSQSQAQAQAQAQAQDTALMGGSPNPTGSPSSSPTKRNVALADAAKTVRRLGAFSQNLMRKVPLAGMFLHSADEEQGGEGVSEDADGSTTVMQQRSGSQRHLQVPTASTGRLLASTPELGSLSPLNNLAPRSKAEVDNRPWTWQDIGQNSISSVLNDPTSASASLAQKMDAMTKQAMNNIPKAQLRHVRFKDFEPYIQYISNVFELYEESRLAVVNMDPGDSDTTSSAGISSPQQQQLQPSPNSQETSPVRADPIATVPSIFFEPDFNMENMRVFDQVTEFANVASVVPSIGLQQEQRQGATTNSVLQEKLSHYLDTVEAHLVAEISRRSSEFFSALANIQSLHAETMGCLTQIREIRHALASTANNRAKKGLEIVRQKRRRNNLGLLYSTVGLVKDVKKTQPMIQVLLNQGDFIGALDLIAEANRIFRGGEVVLSEEKKTITAADAGAITKQISLDGIRGLIHFTGQLAEMTKAIGAIMETEFVKTLEADLAPYNGKELDPSKPSYKWANTILHADSVMLQALIKGPLFSQAELDKEEQLRHKLEPLVMGLVRIERIGPALQAYRDYLTQKVKQVTKECFPQPLPEEKDKPATAQNADGILAKRFRALTFDKFLELVSKLFTALLQVQRRVALYNELITELLREAERRGISIGKDMLIDSENGHPTPNSSSSSTVPPGGDVFKSTNTEPPRYSQFITESADILYSASDLAHVRSGKFLSFRGEQNAQLNFKDFFKLFEVTWGFVTAGEWICQRTCIGLRGTLMTQAKAFLNYFHMERSKQLAMLIDNDQWLQTEVPIDFQQMVDKITRSNNTDNAGVNVPFNGDPDLDLSSSGRADDQDDAAVKNSGRPNMQSYLMVDRKPYFVINSCMMFVKMIEGYVSCAVNMPSITTDVLNRLLEITKLFNTRICGLIVGGAAVQSSILKSITPRHLGLASQSVGFMIALIPYMKSSIEAVLPTKQQILAGEFDRVLQDYRSNQEQIHARIGLIMEERINAQCEAIAGTNWDAEQPAGGSAEAGVSEGSPQMRNFIKDTVKLHRILRKILAPETMKVIFGRIFEMYNKRLEAQLSKLDLYTSSGKNRVLADIQLYIKVLSSLDAIDGPGTRLEVVVNNIRIRDRRERAMTTNSVSPSPVAAVSPQSQAQPQSRAVPQQQQQQQQPQIPPISPGKTMSVNVPSATSPSPASPAVRRPEPPATPTKSTTSTGGGNAGGGNASTDTAKKIGAAFSSFGKMMSSKLDSATSKPSTPAAAQPASPLSPQPVMVQQPVSQSPSKTTRLSMFSNFGLGGHQPSTASMTSTTLMTSTESKGSKNSLPPVANNDSAKVVTPSTPIMAPTATTPSPGKKLEESPKNKELPVPPPPQSPIGVSPVVPTIAVPSPPSPPRPVSASVDVSPKSTAAVALLSPTSSPTTVTATAIVESAPPLSPPKPGAMVPNLLDFNSPSGDMLSQPVLPVKGKSPVPTTLSPEPTTAAVSTQPPSVVSVDLLDLQLDVTNSPLNISVQPLPVTSTTSSNTAAQQRSDHSTNNMMDNNDASLI